MRGDTFEVWDPRRRAQLTMFRERGARRSQPTSRRSISHPQKQVMAPARRTKRPAINVASAASTVATWSVTKAAAAAASLTVKWLR